jgi:hypothetical protein
MREGLRSQSQKKPTSNETQTISQRGNRTNPPGQRGRGSRRNSRRGRKTIGLSQNLSNISPEDRQSHAKDGTQPPDNEESDSDEEITSYTVIEPDDDKNDDGILKSISDVESEPSTTVDETENDQDGFLDFLTMREVLEVGDADDISQNDVADGEDGVNSELVARITNIFQPLCRRRSRCDSDQSFVRDGFAIEPNDESEDLSGFVSFLDARPMQSFVEEEVEEDLEPEMMYALAELAENSVREDGVNEDFADLVDRFVAEERLAGRFVQRNCCLDQTTMKRQMTWKTFLLGLILSFLCLGNHQTRLQIQVAGPLLMLGVVGIVY